MNLYSDLTTLKADLSITATTDDARLLSCLGVASRFIDSFTNRTFYVESGTKGIKYFDGEGEDYLLIPDLLTITSVGEDSDGDNDYTDYAWVVDNDYFLYPPNKYPKTCLEVNWNGDYAVFTRGTHNYKIVGTWGYGNGISTTPYLTTAITVTVATAAGTTLTLSAEGTIKAGHTILVNTEQMYISAVTSNGTKGATAERGVNGTTAAIQDAKAASIYEYPSDVSQGCLIVAERLFETRGKVFASERLGDYGYSVLASESSRSELALLGHYRRLSF